MNSLTSWIDGYKSAWESADPRAVGALFTEDATYRANIFEQRHVGRIGIEAYWSDVTAAQSDVSVRMGRPFVDGVRVTVEFWTNMKVEGEDVTLPGALLLTFDDAWRCTSLREYWHFQPGNHAPPEGWGT